MLASSKVIKSVLFLISFILSLSIASATCIVIPDEIKVSTGSNNLGIVDTSAPIYINPDLQSHPLRIEFTFNNTQAGCFATQNDVQFQLFPSGEQVGATSASLDSASGTGFLSVFTFNFNVDYELTTSLSSTYVVSNTQAGQDVGGLLFAIDNEDPRFNFITLSPNSQLLSPGQNISFTYEVEDSQSGLASLTISGGASEILLFDTDKVFSGIYYDAPQTSTTYAFRVEDNLDKQTTQTVTVVVDGDAPQIVKVTPEYFYDGQQRVSFIVLVEDDSFTVIDEEPDVIGDFTSINSGYSNLFGICTRVSSNQYQCRYNNIPLVGNLSEVKTVSFTATDSLGNTGTYQHTQEVSIDSQGPSITEFYVENGFGIRNIVRPTDEFAKVVVSFTDSSLAQFDDVLINEKFDILPTIEPICLYTETSGTCTWQLEDSLRSYLGIDNQTVTFEVTLVDRFNNPSKAITEVIIDGLVPTIDEIQVLETESIRDNIIRSGERITVKAIVTDRNLFSGNYYIFGNFSLIDYDDGKEMMRGACSQFNTTSVQCDFTNIIVENGYLLENITIIAQDIAGNERTAQTVVEVLKVGNETVSSFDIDDARILNPLNRNLLAQSTGRAWFEPTLELKGSPEIEIVNYQLVACEESDLNPLLITNYGLFPDPIVVNDGQEGIETFAMEVELRGHGNPNDLNTKQMGCQLSVLKRDTTQVYQPEIVDFNLVFEFYDTPRGSLIEAHAQNILEMTEEVEYLGGWFDEMYSVYSTMNSVCGAISGGAGLISGVSQAYTTARWAVSAATAGLSEPVLMTTDSNLFGIQSTISGLTEDGPIKLMCDFVTCRNGGLLGGALLDVLPPVGGEDIVVLYNNVCSSPAQFIGDKNFGDVVDQVGGGGE